ncbi:MAG TPA: tetratricopeptide repeat protein [Parasphingorhabdus sp.]
MLNKYVEARMAESSNRPADAAAIYAETLKHQPDNLLLASKTYVKAIEAGNFDLAIKAVRALELHGAVDPEMPLLLFADAFAKKDYRAARTASLELQSLQNFSFLTPLLNAWIATASGESPLADLTSAKKDETGIFYHQEQSILHALAHGKEAQVMQLIDAMVERNEQRLAPIRIIAARHFLALGNENQALKILKRNRTGPEAKMFRDIESDNARKYAQKVDAQVGAGFLLQRLASDLGGQRAYFPGLVVAQAAARVFPDSDYGHIVMSEAYGQIENIMAAREELEKIPAESAYSLLAVILEIASYVETEDYAAGQARLEKAIAQNPEAPELRALSGQLLQSSHDNLAAAKAFEQAIALAEKHGLPNSQLASYWLALGGAQEQAGLWPDGLESLKIANDLQPNSASILNYLGYAQLERRENTTSAIAAIRKAHELRSSSPAITDSLGWAYFITGQHDKAIDYLEQALSGEPQDPTINEHLGDAYWAVGRKYEARYAWKSAKLFAEGENAQRLAEKIDLGLRADLVSP